jgi:hypothetical protein
VSGSLSGLNDYVSISCLFAFRVLPPTQECVSRQLEDSTPNILFHNEGHGSFLSQNDPRLHFGLGKAAIIERAEVLWPSGRQEVFTRLKTNQVIVLEEGKGATAPAPRRTKAK